MESVPVGTDSPSPALRALLPFGLPQFRATLMESVPVERIPLPLPFLRSLRSSCRS